MTEEELAALVGHRFPGGEYTIEHWENFLLTDCTARGPLADGLVHPIALFHVPIQGAGTSIAELFALAGGSAVPGSVKLLGYDWEYPRALRENVRYRVDGGIVAASRGAGPEHPGGDERQYDDVAFSIELVEPDGVLAARVTNRWRFWR